MNRPKYTGSTTLHNRAEAFEMWMACGMDDAAAAKKLGISKATLRTRVAKHQAILVRLAR